MSSSQAPCGGLCRRPTRRVAHCPHFPRKIRTVPLPSPKHSLGIHGFMEMGDRPRGDPVGPSSDLDTWQEWAPVTQLAPRTHSWAQNMQPSGDWGPVRTRVAGVAGLTVLGKSGAGFFSFFLLLSDYSLYLVGQCSDHFCLALRPVFSFAAKRSPLAWLTRAGVPHGERVPWA